MILAGASAATSLYGARQQAKAYSEQAAQAQIQGRSQAIEYRQQGANVLRNLNETLAATIASAAAGGVDPTSGSAMALQNYARGEAFREYGTALDNATLAKEGAAAQAAIYQRAGRTAIITGIGQAAGQLGTGVERQLSLQAGAAG
jgi:type II secretory pathway pseudopilin PulG